MSDDPDQDEAAAREARVAARQEARAALTATFVDSWATLTWKGHVRIVFGEWLAKKPNYRAAFVMQMEDAKEFAEDLLEQIRNRQEKDAIESAKDQAASGDA